MKVRNPVTAWIVGGMGLTLVAGGFAAATCRADMLLGKDGWVGQVKGANGELPAVSPDDDPPDEVLANSSTSKIDANYETVKLGGTTIPAGQVKKIVSDESVRNDEFRKANSDVQARLYKEAGDEFSAVADKLAGMGKQDALWSAVLAYQAAGLPDETNGAIDALLTAFPKSFYFAPAYTIRARVFLAKGDLEGAKKAFSAISAEKGMNPRDAYRAEYMRIFLTEEAQRQVEAARGDYQKLIDTISRGDPTIGATAAQLATVGLANTLLQAKKPAEAAALYNRTTESHDPDVLAATYAGLGDVAFGEAKGLRDEKKLPEAKAKLEEAALHYLRVTILYRPDTQEDGPVLRSLDNQAKVFTVLFEMSGQKDLDALDKACNSLYQLYQALPDGSVEKKLAVRQYNDLVKTRRELAEKPDDTKGPTPPKKDDKEKKGDKPG